MKLYDPFDVAIRSYKPLLMVFTMITCIGILIGGLYLLGPSIVMGSIFLVAVARVLFAIWYGY